MITGTLRSQIDKLWTEFWTGGITNPLSVIEQISYLMFARLLDTTESRNERKAKLSKKPFKRIFPEDQQHLRWSSFKNVAANQMLPLVRDQVFPFFRDSLGKRSTFGTYMNDAQLLIQKPSLLVSAVNMIDALPLEKGDTKGDLYEYLLGKLTTAGINGQFRTPRHIIRLMVDLLEPKPFESVADPACGTAGFLVGVMLYLLEKFTSSQGIQEQYEEDEPPNGKESSKNGAQQLLGLGGEGKREGRKLLRRIYSGDLLEPYREHIQTKMFYGFDFDSTMLRIASMNLMLHGVEAPHIEYQDTLSNSFPEKFPYEARDCFDVILANPPFKGSLDESDVHPSLTGKVKTKKTELLFMALILRMLRQGGRSATIVPDGVLFGSSKAHTALRKMLVEENQLEGIFSLPSGVFKPYAGVSTAIVVFTKGGKTEDVFFYDVKADGYSLDDKRDPVEENDLPGALERWKKRDAKKDTDRTKSFFFVPVKEIQGNKYDLSINRYKEAVHEEVSYEPPKVILERLQTLEDEIFRDIKELRGML